MFKQDEFSLVTGRFNVCGEVIEFTRQEAIIFFMLNNYGAEGVTMDAMVTGVYMDLAMKNYKTAGVHLFNIRKKMAHTACDIVYDKRALKYRMVKKNG
jgi:hypothetical protein